MPMVSLVMLIVIIWLRWFLPHLLHYKTTFSFPSPYPIFFFFWPHRKACGISVPQSGIEPAPSAVKVQSPNHWTSREFPP